MLRDLTFDDLTKHRHSCFTNAMPSVIIIIIIIIIIQI